MSRAEFGNSPLNGPERQPVYAPAEQVERAADRLVGDLSPGVKMGFMSPLLENSTARSGEKRFRFGDTHIKVLINKISSPFTDEGQRITTITEQDRIPIITPDKDRSYPYKQTRIDSGLDDTQSYYRVSELTISDKDSREEKIAKGVEQSVLDPLSADDSVEDSELTELALRLEGINPTDEIDIYGLTKADKGDRVLDVQRLHEDLRNLAMAGVNKDIRYPLVETAEGQTVDFSLRTQDEEGNHRDAIPQYRGRATMVSRFLDKRALKGVDIDSAIIKVYEEPPRSNDNETPNALQKEYETRKDGSIFVTHKKTIDGVAVTTPKWLALDGSERHLDDTVLDPLEVHSVSASPATRKELVDFVSALDATNLKSR